MPQRKIAVKFNGKIIGTRRTDRSYTHALVLTDYNPAEARRREAAEWERFGKDGAHKMHAHAFEARLPSYRYAGGVTDAERAAYEVIAAMPREDYVAQQRASRLKALEATIAERAWGGAVVLSYHGSEQLAVKARDVASKVHTEYAVVIAAVEAA